MGNIRKSAEYALIQIEEAEGLKSQAESWSVTWPCQLRRKGCWQLRHSGTSFFTRPVAVF